MTNLVSAYERRDVHEAERIIKSKYRSKPAPLFHHSAFTSFLTTMLSDCALENHDTILKDEFIRSNLSDVLRSLRTQYLVDLIKPYTRMQLDFLAQQLNIEMAEVEELLIELILDGKVKGKIDQRNARVELEQTGTMGSERYHQLSTWSRHISNLSRTIVDKSGAVRGGPDASGNQDLGEFDEGVLDMRRTWSDRESEQTSREMQLV